MDIKKKKITENIVKNKNRLPRRVVQSSSLDIFKRYIWHLGTWWSGGLGSVKLLVGLNYSRRFFQPKQFCDSMIYTVFDQVEV